MIDSESAGGALAMLAALGAFHGINPAMGWLFAVALGMQAQRRAAVWRAVAALGVGHALAIAVAMTAAGFVLTLVTAGAVRMAVAGLLVAMGIASLVRMRHPRLGSMRIGFAGLIGWSFVMASAHGAGLMVLPVVLDAPLHAAGAHGAHTAAALDGRLVWIATAVHGAAYLAVTAAIAWVVYEKIGVTILRRAWVNLDAIWAGALIVTGIIALLVA